ncbi:hypothetical protein [Stackebrandtia soli]|uniref:hypothetical protein n=1 Tax=Stackebrandtia soli TaxID=1892856 RepID=UPI0039E83DC8
MTEQDIQRAIEESHGMGAGLARNAHLERVWEAARSHGDGSLVVKAGMALIRSYEYSSEDHKMLIPFARLLSLWDKDPAAFDASDRRRLFWYFKWASSSLTTRPQVPLAAAEDWTRRMRQRYAEAGYSDNAVLKAELFIAQHVGDEDRAAEAFEKWRASPRDTMSDCHACDDNASGDYHLLRGDDENALREWAPVLSGNRTCAEEPERVLGSSLLPLVRLGRIDEARTNHLRGYRMVAGLDSLHGAVGEHIEFCALTGNEARGLRILLDHSDWITTVPDVDVDRHFLAAVLVLSRRLIALGQGEHTVPGPRSRQWTIAELASWLDAELTASAARFDARNGTSHVSTRLRERLDQEPFPAIPLGYSRRLPGGGHASDPPAGVDVTRPDASVESLIAEAWAAELVAHPDARHRWRALDVRVTADGLEPDAACRAAIALYEALNSPDVDEAAARITAAEAFAAAGRIDRAVVERARAAMLLAGDDDFDAADAQLAAMTELGEVPPYATFIRRHAPIEIDLLRLGPGAADDVDDRLRALGEEWGDLTDEVCLVANVRVLASLARNRLQVDDFPAAIPHLRRAIDLADAAERGWLAGNYAIALGRVLTRIGDVPGAAVVFDEALRRPVLDDDVRAELHFFAAPVHAALGDAVASRHHAAAATDWFDRVDTPEGKSKAQFARYYIARSYMEENLSADAATILEGVLADEPGPELVSDVRAALGKVLVELHQPLAAVEHFVALARAAQTEGRHEEHASYASQTAEALSSGSRRDEALAAYAEARRLWADLDQPIPVARIARSEALLTVEFELENLPTFERSMLDVRAELARELGDASAETDLARALHHEIAETNAQLAERMCVLVVHADKSCDVDCPDECEEHDEERRRTAETMREPGGVYERAAEYARSAVDGFAALSAHSEQVRAAARLGEILLELSLKDEAMAVAEAAMPIAEALGDPMWIQYSLKRTMWYATGEDVE